MNKRSPNQRRVIHLLKNEWGVHNSTFNRVQYKKDKSLVLVIKWFDRDEQRLLIMSDFLTDMGCAITITKNVPEIIARSIKYTKYPYKSHLARKYLTVTIPQ